MGGSEYFDGCVGVSVLEMENDKAGEFCSDISLEQQRKVMQDEGQ